MGVATLKPLPLNARLPPQRPAAPTALLHARCRLKPNVVLCCKVLAERPNDRDAHDPISSMLGPASVMLILELQEFEVFHFEKKAVEHDDTDFGFD